MPLSIINEKLNSLLTSSSPGNNLVEINFHDFQIPSFDILTEKGRNRFSIEKGKLLSAFPDPEVMNIINEFYSFSKHTLIREWNQNRPSEGSYAIEQIKFDLDIPTTQTMELSYTDESDNQPPYQIKYRFNEEKQIIKLEFALFPRSLGTRDQMKISYRSIIFLLSNLGPVSDRTVQLIIRKLHSDILMDAVFFAITSDNLKIDLVLFKKFIKEHEPIIIISEDLDINEFLPVYDRPYTTKRNVRIRK
ncbi:MAG: hypothetical protein ABIQ02_04315 [Saprospiraceae bacterium]